MIITIVAEGWGETAYGNKTIIIGNADISEKDVQDWGDEWKKSIPADKLDRFDDVDLSKTTIEEIVAAMPKEWDAKVGKDTAHMLFL